MRVVALLFLVMASCGESGLGIEDLSVPEDLSAPVDLKPKADMAMPPLGCAGVVQCLMGGTSSANCLARATPTGQMLLNDMFACGVSTCIDTDAGTGDCVDENDQSDACFNCAIGSLMSGGCPTEVAACFADT